MNKSMKPSAPKPLTEEQKQEQVIRFLAQKRESFIQGILFNLCQGVGCVSTDTGKQIVDSAISMADHLMETLFPIKETPAE